MANKRYRDAETGQYISFEETKTRDKSTWVAEATKDETELLEEVYEQLLERYWSERNVGSQMLNTYDLEEVFGKFGIEPKFLTNKNK